MEHAELPISVFLRKDYQPHPFDLSGETVFDFYFDIKRCYPSDNDYRDLTLLVNESVFDILYAFEEGLLELIDEETGAVVVWPGSGKKPPKRLEKKFITLPRQSSIPGRRGDRIRSIPFEIFNELNSILQPGRQYRIWLRDLDLNVKWWSFDPPSNLTDLDSLPSSEKGKLVAKTTTNKLFLAVPSIRSPPLILISVSLSTSTVSYSGPPPKLRVSITNQGPKPITVKSSREQTYISTNHFNTRGPRITCPRTFPSLTNFLITTSSSTSGSRETILNMPDSPSAGPHGLSRVNFTTLEPGIPLVMEGSFLVQKWIRDKLKNHAGDGSEGFSLRLKRQEAWWCEGGVEELFEGREKLSWQDLWKSTCLPVVLESEDCVTFRMVD